MEMFCYECEQAAKGTGCTVMGVCGKNPDIAKLQDLLIHATKGLSMYAHVARELGIVDTEVDGFVIESLFTIVTNVDFDPERLESIIRKSARLRDRMRAKYQSAYEKANGKEVEELTGPALWEPAKGLQGLIAQGWDFSVPMAMDKIGKTLAGLDQFALYGLMGLSAYVHHAMILGVRDEDIFAEVHRLMNFLATRHSVDEVLGKALEVGELNLKAMELLDRANTDTYGHPEPTSVLVTPVKGKAILVSGHDLADLEILLKQTEGTGINIYTHSEMLPTLAYPKLKKYSHLVGNYGGAWQDQLKEFDEFPGAILMTTNCIQKPRDSYKYRIFTTGLVAFPGVTHIGEEKDFAPVIKAAMNEKGFTEDAPEKKIMIGFARNAVLSVADKVIEAVKAGAIKHFFLVGGCDGAKSERNYYTELAKQIPDDCVILTLACGKFRFNKLEFGDIGGIPRLLDIGQCNDAYSAIQIAVALAGAFECGVNELPLSFILSWYEQKAIAILLTLLHLGIRNIRIGPSLPASLTPEALEVLVKLFNIMPIGTPEEDLKAILGN
jgi:hydroxylamine reductase